MKTLEDLKKELFRDKPGLEQKYLEGCQVKLISIKGVDLLAFRFNDYYYVPVKKLCEIFNLGCFGGHLKRIKRKPALKNCLVLMPVFSNGGNQLTSCLRIDCIELFIELANLSKTEFVRRNQDQFIYLIDYGCNYYKIGLTQNLRKRFRNLNTGSPYDLKLIDSFKTTNSLGVEKTLHKMFKKNLVKGKKEFFMFDKKTLGEVKSVFRLYGSEV